MTAAHESAEVPYPISILPHDVLHQIFLMVLDEYTKHDIWPQYTGMVIGQVCRSWRYVAIDVPNMWTTIQVYGTSPEEMTHTFLERSQTMPLRVKLTGTPYEPEMDSNLVSHARLLSRHIGRFFRLELCAIDLEILQAILPHFGHPAPILRHLSLEANMLYDVDADKLFDPATYQLASELAIETPVLNELSVTTATVPLDCYINLSTLILMDQATLLPEDLFNVLRQSPQLQFLVVGVVGPMFPTDTIVADDAELSVISLPCLTDIHLAGLQDDVYLTLAHLDFPTTATVNVRFLAHERYNIDGALLRCHALHALTGSVAHVRLRTLQHDDVLALALDDADGALALAWEWYTMEADAEFAQQDWMRLDALRFPAAARLTLADTECNVLLDAAGWMRVLDTLPNLADLHVAGALPQDPATLLGALGDALANPAPVPPAAKGKARAAPRYPRLASCRFWVPAVHDEETVETFVAWCEARADMGAPMDRFEILLNEHKQYSDALMSRLRACAGDVVVQRAAWGPPRAAWLDEDPPLSDDDF
ncbi:hypothetical protein WOLCODRAFT_138824 [Wolfiporia cocos MD-104 SS10]|uniref:Uncharacterized protein n=1 Tax=Wolfiporia cocos (strain MD-104) TaxID=742152 RepID=A0A2H3JQJ6_WOLCO|nr:hypothetical protein WOLCODRAFT_138824 [Wolfiporia cocos MD-104 SS10]